MYENYLPSSKLSSLKPEKYTGWLKEMFKKNQEYIKRY